ncbi:hypothetical protein BDZ91DRAFT_718828 [Kalaharituber pfeilii]|nr:hypothetical protein BDZ91DRAFT_718828 [Kalaharituber pfeilii]
MHLFRAAVICLVVYLTALVSAAPAPAPADLTARDDVPDATIYTGDSVRITGGEKVNAVEYCFIGWDDVNYKSRPGSVPIEACCEYTCCDIHIDMLNNRLYSAKASQWLVGSKGVALWTGYNCQGDFLGVDYEGWWNLANAPAYYSVSVWW